MFMGMNRQDKPSTTAQSGVPHVHGDEPNSMVQLKLLRSRVPHVHGDEPP